MSTIKLEVEDSRLDIVLNIIQNLKDDLISKYEVISDNNLHARASDSAGEEKIDFSKYHIPSIEKIEDPVQWQRDIRDEWEK